MLCITLVLGMHMDLLYTKKGQNIFLNISLARIFIFLINHIEPKKGQIFFCNFLVQKRTLWNVNALFNPIPILYTGLSKKSWQIYGS